MESFKTILTHLLKVCFLFVMTVGLSFAMPASPTSASTIAIITVTTTSDEFNASGPGTGCSLREAIYASNTSSAFGGCSAGGGETNIIVPAGDFVLSKYGANDNRNGTGDLDLLGNINIKGAGIDLTNIYGGKRDRVFDIHAGASVEISELTIKDGKSPDGVPGIANPADNGGGIRNAGSLLLSNVSLSRNETGEGSAPTVGINGDGGRGGNGGGIYNSGTLTIVISSISENETGDGGEGGDPRGDGGNGGHGGGIYNAPTGVLTISNSTISLNETGKGGNSQKNSIEDQGGLGGNGGGVYNLGTMTISNSTITDNKTGNGGSGENQYDGGHGGYGGGITSEGGTLNLINVTISSNLVGSGISGGHGGYGGGIYGWHTIVNIYHSIVANNKIKSNSKGPDCFGDLNFQEYNLVREPTDCPIDTTTMGNMAGTDPLLTTLGNYGGPTLTRALQPGSPALDHIPGGNCDTNVDQRGLGRPNGIGCDIGAVEGAYDPNKLPSSGFSPGKITRLPAIPSNSYYTDIGNLNLEVPKLDQKLSIIGIPMSENGWDLTWLNTNAGYLTGTAYPTWTGNTALTAHAVLPDGNPGPFYNLDTLSWNDDIIIHAWGKQFNYKVRSVEIVTPDDMSALQHEEYDWITLISCKGYNPKTDTYHSRVVVKAVLISVDEE